VYIKKYGVIGVGSVEVLETAVQFPFFGIWFFVLGVVYIKILSEAMSLPLASDQTVPI